MTQDPRHMHIPLSHTIWTILKQTRNTRKNECESTHAAHTNSRVHLCWGLVVIYDLKHLHSRPSQIHDWSVLKKDSITEEYRQP